MNPMHLYRRLRHTLYHNPMRSLSPVTLLTTFGAALFWTIWSPLVDSFTHSPSLTGVIVALLAALSVGYSLILNPGLSRLDHKELFVYGVALMGICFLLFLSATTLAALLIVCIFFLLGYVLHRLGLFRRFVHVAGSQEQRFGGLLEFGAVEPAAHLDRLVEADLR